MRKLSDKENWTVFCLEINALLRRGGRAEEEIAEARKNQAWGMSRRVKISTIIESFVIGVLQASPKVVLPPKFSSVLRTFSTFVSTDLCAGQDVPAISASSLFLFNRFQHYMLNDTLFSDWAAEMDLEVALFNGAKRIEDETSWHIVPSDSLTKSNDIYGRWRQDRFIYVNMVSWAFISSLMKLELANGNFPPAGLNNVLRWIEYNLRRKHEFVGQENNVFQTKLVDLMGDLGAWIQEDKKCRAWVSALDLDQLLLQAMRWLDAETFRVEVASMEAQEIDIET